MTENFNILVNKLNSFRLKYYLFQLLKGLILVFALLLAMFILFSVVEYNIYLSRNFRKLLFFGFTIFGSLLMIRFVVIPLLKLFHIIKPIDLKSASVIIQNNFTDVEDKLLNIIELANNSSDGCSNEIVLASIDQKIDNLKLFDFNDAVQFKNLKIASIYLVVSVFITGAIYLVNNKIFTESTQRIVHFNQEFVKPARYTFHLENNNLQATKGESFKWELRCEGDEIPQVMYINIEGNNYLMKNVSIGDFQFEMASVINPLKFYFTDLKFNSETYTLSLLPKPGITQFHIGIFPPSYTGIQNQVLNNVGDLQVPNGSRVEWNFSGIDIDSLYMVLNDSVKVSSKQNKGVFNITSGVFKSTNYNVFIQNAVTNPELALSFHIEVIPDLYPEISIIQVPDSFQLTRYFFKGVIGDDYGFTDLKFHYNIDSKDSSISLPIVKTLNDQDFYFSFDFADLKSSSVVNYYFSVTDNDIVDDYKTTTSDSFTFDFPDEEEISATEKQQFQQLQDMVDESKELAGDIKNELDNLRLKNMDTGVSDWEKSQMVNDIISKQNKLEQLYDKIKQDNESLNKYLNSFGKQNEEIIEKQKQIEDLLGEVFTDELKELMEEFNKLSEKFDSKKLNQLAEKMDLSYDDLQKQLDRNLEMLRKMKIEQKIQDVIDKLSEKAGNFKQISEQVLEDKNYDNASDKLSNEKEHLGKLEENVNDALELNKKLDKPLNFDRFKDEFNEIDKSLEEDINQLNKKNKKKASEGINNTSQQLQNLAFAMKQMLEANNSKQNAENIDNLKQILSNLVTLSFNQEDVLDKLSGISQEDPMLIQLNIKQKRIVDQSKIVQDSLYSLAMRTPQISSMVNNELLAIQMNLDKVTEEMEEAQFPRARVNQQFVMTSVNNLALMLNEALENLEKKMADGMPGDQECENPGGKGKPLMNMLKKASDNIKQQLQQMIEQMKNGDPNQLGKELGKSLMQHEMMQQMLREMINSGGVGSTAKSTLQQIDKLLDQNRKELMNRSVNAQTIARQNLINTRLLQAENAERERDFDEKRESKSAEEFYSNPAKFFEYKDKENYSIEFLDKNSYQLSNFYNYKYKQYLDKIQK